ncbi:phage scaffolding protein [Streptomyces bobili]|uniref:phage scaffolding protein n=1 Tax=Streptomyces bobili TaxID=67280 RepID=UPI002258F0F8|nr:phage scaffolding protein [Streptomyces bobili]MCX5522205.1 phage scaffolding protein [Streptomyces bobili]
MGIHPDTDPLDGISLPPGLILGYRADGRPIHVIAGGAEPDDEPDTEVDDEPEAEPETDDEPETAERPKPKAPAKPTDPKPDEEYVPPSREEWERVRRTMAARKQEKADVQRQLNELRDKYKEQETETEKAVREAEEKAEARYKPIAVRKAVRAALVEAGATAATEGDKAKTEARIARLMKLVDVGDLSIDDDGEVLGVDEQIDGLRADYPELFDAPARKAKPRPTGAPRPAAAEKPKSTAEIHANRILGRA